MEAQKNKSIQLVKDILIAVTLVLISSFIGVVLLGAVYMIPSDSVREHIKESSSFLSEHDDHYKWNGNGNYYSEVDLFTDSLMMSTAAYNGDMSLVDKVLLNPRFDDSEIPQKSDDLVEDVKKIARNDHIVTYPRYWHGYLLVLKPLLVFLNVSEVRLLTMIIYMCLFCADAVIVFQKTKLHGTLLFVICNLILNPVSVMQCLQFSSCVFLMLVYLFILLHMDERLTERRRRTLFMLLGISTAFFDLLTFPLMPLGILLIYHILIKNDSKNELIEVFRLCISWAGGYAGMWGMKWVIASILTEVNVVSNALEQILKRSASTVTMSGNEVTKITIFDVIKQNGKVIVSNRLFAIAVVVFVLYLLIKAIRRKYILSLSYKRVFALLFVSVIPFVWFLFTKNHSMIHFWMTFRILTVSFCGVLAMMY